ncbi:MAG: ABC transporter substrate-binding protein [Haloarculaceae archaeon]
MGSSDPLTRQESPDRRTYLKLLGAGGAATLAGCMGGGGGGGEETTTESSGGGGEETQGNGGGEETTTERPDIIPGGHLRTTAIAAPQSLSPFVGDGQGDYVFFELMYDRLVGYNRDYEPVPRLARDWEPNDDTTAWTFMLTDQAKFANIDKKVLGEDVKATVEVMLSEDRVPGASVDLGAVDKDNPVVVEDDHRVTINLSKKDPFYPARLGETGSYFNIVPKEILDNRFDELSTTDFGSGPFTLTDYESDSQYHFEKHDWYIEREGRELPYLDEITAKIIPDPVSQASALTGKRVDVINTLDPSLRSRIENAGNASVRQYSTSAFLSMVMTTNMELDNGDKPFSKLKVRQAMKHALDREEIVSATDGTMTIGHHDPVAPVHPGYGDFDEGLEFGTTAQTEKAKGLLEEAGYGDGLELPTPIYENEFQARRGTCVKLFQQQAKKAGIEFDIRLVSPDTWLSKYWNQDGKWYASGYAARMEQTTVPRLALGPDAKWDSGRWDNEQYHEAYNKFSTTTTSDPAFQKAFTKAQRISHLDNAWIIFGFLDQQAASNDYLSHFDPGPAANKDFNYDAALSPDAPKGPNP